MSKPASSMIRTPDGTVIVVDAEVGSASGRNEFEAWREIERRKAAKREKVA